jgi:hypothetical protein
LVVAVEAAASRDLRSMSDYLRAAVLAALKRDGIKMDNKSVPICESKGGFDTIR